MSARSSIESSALGSIERWAPHAVILYTAVALAVSLLFHPTPLYHVETDLVGGYVPAAQSLAQGRLAAEHYSYKGPGYPLLLAAVAPLCGGDYYLAARLLSVAAAGAAAWLAFLVVRSFAGVSVALLMLAGLLANPTFLRYAIEAGTDTPALALALLSTYGVLRAPAPGWLLGAGFAAGFAIVTRYNAAFLLPAAAAVLLWRSVPWRMAAGYAAGVLLPLGIWLGVNAQLTGDPLRNDNYISIAYELYGRDLPLDRFGAEIGWRFQSLRDVLLFDPLRAVLRILWNLGAHFVSDLHDLLPIWIGVLAGPGLWLGFRRPDWRPAALHFGLCALVLAPVFYASRFSLYLLPFYLAGAAVLFLQLPAWVGRVVSRAPKGRGLSAGVPALGMALVLVSGVAAVSQLREQLSTAPHETRDFGRLLADRGVAGERVMARKPHVAYFAGMNHVPMGVPSTIIDLIAEAHQAKAAYLLYSPIERILRPEFAVLSDSAVALPGLEQVAYRSWGSQNAYALYRLTGARVSTAVMAEAMDRALERYLERRSTEPEAQVFAAMQLLNANRHREALERLRAVVVQGGGEDPAVVGLLSTAYFGLRDYSRSYRACEAAMKLERPRAWHYARLGEIRARQNRFVEARNHLRRAVEMEPGNPKYLEGLGMTYSWLGEYGPAAAAFDRCVRLSPRDARMRRYAMGAYQLAGNDRRAVKILEAGTRLGIPVEQMLDPVATGARTRDMR